MKIWMAIAMISVFSKISIAQLQGRANVEKLCGCFDVNFKYAETFSPDPNYKYHERDETNAGTELVLPLEISETKIILQHLLVISDSVIVKHWREEWSYENPVIWKFAGNGKWVKEQLNVQEAKGKWTQAVWEVSDAPRYQGTGEWIEADNKIFWLSTVDAPLPRREYTVRNDYNILRRTNRIIVSDSGWMHEQDNQKLIRKAGTDQLLVEEKGMNSYRRINDRECEAGKRYWERNKEFWSRVEMAWETYMNEHSKIELKLAIDGKPMHDYLFALAKEYAAGKKSSESIKASIRQVMERFLM